MGTTFRLQNNLVSFNLNTMNWKINYWTILFAVVALASSYLQFFSKPAAAPAAETPKTELAVQQATTCTPTSIPNTLGNSRSAKYLTEWANVQPANAKIINPNVYTFLLKKCELQQMLAYTGTKDSVYAVLGINSATTPTSKDTIDLLFKVFSNSTTYQYFDFSNPCPPDCNN